MFMEIIKVEKGEDIAELIKCKADEILFVRYDSNKDPDATSDLMNDIFTQCQALDVPCMFMPLSDDDVYLELEQWELDRLRKFDNKLQEIIKKKSPIILQ